VTDRDAGAQAAGSGANGHHTAWISRGLEELIHDIGAQTSSREGCDFDVIIVGSGYGGAVAAARLAGCTHDGGVLKVCVLERGREYLPGMFPQRMADLARHVRFVTEGKACPRGEREGLFDVRVGADVCAVVANGLGGGSLINAGVMEEPLANVFEHGWPAAITLESLRPSYDEARKLLGAVIVENRRTRTNTIEEHPDGVPAKFEALARLATSSKTNGKPFRATAITIAMTDKRNSSGVALKQCLRCGDCATGCNHQAKDSLDVNLLVAAARAGARIYTGATVLKIERTKEVKPGPGTAYIDVAPDTRDTEPTVWTLDVVHTEGRLRARQGPPFRITARKVILAAGTFGSTEILMRSQTETLKFSPRLGQQFSTNGDMIAVAYDQDIESDGKRRDVNAAADETTPPRSRAVGPTITGLIDLRGSGDEDLVVEELAVPGPLARLFDETVTMGNLLQGLARADTDAHKRAGPPQDPCAVDGQAMRRSSIVALMGDDNAAGALELVGDDDERDGDSAVRVRWPGIHKHPLFPLQIDTLRTLAAESATRGEILPNPLWQLLPDKMQMLLDDKRGPLLTVHPLGGCPMADVVHDGVVDPLGRVFDGRFVTISRELPGLVVLDGSIVPVALRINPSLTIAALALRAIDGLRTAWGYTPPAKTPAKHEARPVFVVPPDPVAPRRTEVEFVERMSGAVTIAGKGGGAVRCVVELTMRFGSVALADLFLPGKDGRVPMKRTLHVEKGMMRVFRKAAWEAWRVRGGHEDELGALVEVEAPITGDLDFLHREASTQDERQCRALRSWFVNRGLRDVVQEAIERWTDGSKLPSDLGAYLRARWEDLKALASHAGEVRQFEYRLVVSDPIRVVATAPFDVAAFERRRAIAGRKRFTYERSSNPWRQLSKMTLETFPGLVDDPAPVLELDTTYLAQERIPLMRIVKQQDEPSALADLASFGAYFVRLLLSVHVWSFRRPDAAEPREPQRLPGMVDGLPAPVIRELDLGAMKDGRPVRVRLTRYPRLNSGKPPVVMIHGYSASGTTFAHPAVDPNLARYMWDRKRDVWILDLRTSSGMPTARYPWAFEEVALADLPAAFDYIARTTGKKLDIFAHCMGSAMFSMALLAPPASGDPFFRERDALPGIIHRVVLSQIGPVVVFSPANIFRAYLMSYLRNFLPLANYEFRVGPDPSLTDQLIDRFLAAMPYPEKEFSLENPFWPPWRRTPFVGTRHRMDALYGRDFNLENIDDRVLDYVDDLFGPLSIDTVSQAINFARLEVITSRAGRNEYVSRDNFLRRWRVDDRDIPTLSIHGSDNGLADVATLARMKKLLVDDLGFQNFETHAFAGFGHQDSLIGRNAGEVFAVVHEFLDRD
jgi:choline dehydrogenase-like flavoprotein/pimeloyl-ACP methyl ester carboxylesterase